MTSSPFRVLLQLRTWFAAAATALLLAGCGGGGDGGGTLFGSPDNVALRGTWQLSVEVDGAVSAPVSVVASDVPTAEMVAQFDTAAVAQQIGTTTFQGYVVAVSGNTIRVTDPDTNYVLVINSFAASDYQGCGGCGVGSTVGFTLTANISESGVFDGRTVPATTGTMVVRFRYTRIA